MELSHYASQITYIGKATKEAFNIESKILLTVQTGDLQAQNFVWGCPKTDDEYLTRDHEYQKLHLMTIPHEKKNTVHSASANIGNG